MDGPLDERGQLEFRDVIKKQTSSTSILRPPAARPRPQETSGVKTSTQANGSSGHPDGLPGHPGSNRERVEAANELHKFAARAAERLEAFYNCKGAKLPSPPMRENSKKGCAFSQAEKARKEAR